MRVLIISIDKTWFGRENSGDVVERHQEYAERLGGSLDIIVMTKRGCHPRHPGHNLNVYPTNSFSKLLYVLDAFRIAADIRWPDEFDLVVTQDPFLCGLTGWLIKKKFKAPLLVHFHGDFWQNRYWLFNKKRWWFNWFFLILSKFLVGSADGIRVVSSGIRDKLVRSSIRANKIRIIPTPVNTAQFRLFDINKVRALKKKNQYKKTIFNVGRRDPSKDYPTLYKTVSLVYEKYRNLAFWQVGSGECLACRIPADENLVLTPLDQMSQSELVNYYYASDIYISSSCHESFGKVLVEAMACGLPVVATATTGSKEIVINGRNGFLVPIGDSKMMARKIIYLLNNPDKAKKMGKNGKKMVYERFNRKKTIKEVVDFWQTLAKL